jgi:hypothetical protein
MRDYFKVAIVAKSGAGKTYSLRNLDPNTTGFINMENKPLPFINNFVHYCTPKSFSEAYQKIIEYGQNKDIKVIVIDSFSAYQEDALILASTTKKGFDVWNDYNMNIRSLMKLIKLVPKDVLITAHYQIVQIDNGSSSEKRIGVKGNEHNVTGIEGNFTMVVFADMKMVDNKRQFIYKLLTSGNDTAKTPPYLIEALGGEEIPNDAKLVIDAINSASIKA